LAGPLFDLCKQLHFSTSAWVLIAFPVRQLLTRVPIPLSSIPRRWWNFLVKRSWFRGLLDKNSDVDTTITVGVQRVLPFVLGPPIHTTPFRESLIRELGDQITLSLVNEWTGVPVPPMKQKTPHQKFYKLRSKFRLGRQAHRWERLWLKPVLDLCQDYMPDMFISGDPVWVDDQPGLQVTYRLTRQPVRRPFSFGPRIDEFVPTLCHDGSVIFRAC